MFSKVKYIPIKWWKRSSSVEIIFIYTNFTLQGQFYGFAYKDLNEIGSLLGPHHSDNSLGPTSWKIDTSSIHKHGNLPTTICHESS
jgi:hypothetical protein